MLLAHSVPYQLWMFIRLTRPVFLLGGALLFGMGAALAARTGAPVRLDHYLLGQWIVTAIQLSAQYANEYYDMEADSLNQMHRTWLTGGSGVLPSGRLPGLTAFRAMNFFTLAAVLSLLFTAFIAPWVAVLGLIALVGSRAYSAPPLALMGTGWGELSASIIVALLVPLTGYAMFAAAPVLPVLALCLPVLLIHMAMLITFSIPDDDADRRAGKRTLVVRYGRLRAAQIHHILLAAAFVLFLVYSAFDMPAARFIWAAAPLAVLQAASVSMHSRLRWSNYPLLTTGAVGLFVLVTILILAGLIVP